MDSILKHSFQTTRSKKSMYDDSSLFHFEDNSYIFEDKKTGDQFDFLQNLEDPAIEYRQNFLQREDSAEMQYPSIFQENLKLDYPAQIQKQNRSEKGHHQSDDMISETYFSDKITRGSIQQQTNNQSLEQLVDILCKIWQNESIQVKDINTLPPLYIHALNVMIQKKFDTTSNSLVSQLLLNDCNIEKKSELKDNQLLYVKKQQQNKQKEEKKEKKEIKMSQKRNTKRHEEQYKFLSKRFVKYLKQTQKLKLSFLIENFQIYFETLFPEFRFQDYFKCNERKRQFVLRKSNKFFFEIIFHHPVLTDCYLTFRNKFLEEYKLEIRDKFYKILQNIFIEQNDDCQTLLSQQQSINNYNCQDDVQQQSMQNGFVQKRLDTLNNVENQDTLEEKWQQQKMRKIEKKLNSKNLKLPWSFVEIQQAFQFVSKTL